MNTPANTTEIAALFISNGDRAPRPAILAELLHAINAHGEDLSGLDASIRGDWSIPAEWRHAVSAYCLYRAAPVQSFKHAAVA